MELTVVPSMVYPTEIFEVTRDIVDNCDTVPPSSTTPGAADKVVVVFD
jgi:hypothetical protein